MEDRKRLIQEVKRSEHHFIDSIETMLETKYIPQHLSFYQT